MKPVKISFKPNQTAATVDVEAHLPASIAEAVKEWGEDNVLSLMTRQVIVDLQGILRSAYNSKEAVKTPEALAAKAKAYKPGQHINKKSKVDKLVDSVGQMTPEERAALLARLTGAQPKKVA